MYESRSSSWPWLAKPGKRAAKARKQQEAYHADLAAARERVRVKAARPFGPPARRRMSRATA